eukprot:547804_1
MAFLLEAVKLYKQLEQSYSNPHSEIWNEFLSVYKKIQVICNSSGINSNTSSIDKNKIFLKKKHFWTTHLNNKVNSIEHILKCLLFYGNHHRRLIGFDWTNNKGIENSNRKYLLAVMEVQLSYCYITFENVGGMHMIFSTGIEAITFVSEFPNLLTPLDCERMFWLLFICLHTMTDPNGQECVLANLAFLMIFCKDSIQNMLCNKTEKELQTQIISISNSAELQINTRTLDDVTVIKLSKYIIRFRHNTDIYGVCLVQKLISTESPNIKGDFTFSCAKMYYKYRKYLDAKKAFIKAIIFADSFVIMALSLQYLSKLCKHFGEYGIGLRCLKRAYKLCCVEKDISILPSFVQTSYPKKQRSFMNKLNKIKCGYCAIKNGIELRSCTGCMKVMYCNKRCQKMHWKSRH